jgi:predicted metal-dependent peptidase
MSTNLAAPAAVRLTLRYPFWTELYYSMTVHEATPEQVAQGIETQATDGRNLWINAAFFTSIPLDQQISELVHELCHKMLLHCTRRGSRDPKIWNIACDYVINAMMKKNGFTIPADWLLDMQYDGWLAENVYADLMKNQREKGHTPTLPPGRLDIRAPQQDGGQPLTPEQVEKIEDEVRQLVEKAIANAKAIGKLPLGIEAGTVEVFRPAREPWYNHLHRYMQALRSAEYNWARLNRRTLRSHGIFTPLHYSEALGDVALFIDTSGSCFRAASQANFAAHLNAILAEAKPRRTHVYYFDVRVYPGEVIEASELDVATHPRGNGGTAFEPIFEALENEGIAPDVCIILTDLEGSFPDQAPDYPVVWANVKERGVAPFGETIHVTD